MSIPAKAFGVTPPPPPPLPVAAAPAATPAATPAVMPFADPFAKPFATPATSGAGSGAGSGSGWDSGLGLGAARPPPSSAALSSMVHVRRVAQLASLRPACRATATSESISSAAT